MEEEKNYIQNIEKEYMDFTGVKFLPEIHVRRLKQDNKVFAVASYRYPPKTHYLTISPQIIEKNADYLLYHEFTHIIDNENYCSAVQGEEYNNFGYSGFSASMIEMMKLAGAETICEQFSFKLSDTANIIGYVGNQMSLSSYVWEGYQYAIDKFTNSKFNILNDFTKAIELLFNFWGRRYVCQRYAMEQDDTMNFLDFSSIEARLCWDNNNPIQEWNKLLAYQIIDKQKLKLANKLCYKTICHFIKAYGLKETNPYSDSEELFTLSAININDNT